ncbi:hypothetical protein QJS10_CPA16g00621 [Acorus calamus]|uniref:CCHC-type domain-containing protein n=1 Tax=Acorus calamus TaxID=4465 RepID=A0AAV9D087_ACOCL|nr:hypothetical protein QJS10_CPA16g00621 [Acorus calamus]
MEHGGARRRWDGVEGSSKGQGGDWVLVSRKRKWVVGGERNGLGGGSNGLRCYRCLNLGHRAMACREPPTCWSCGKRGHRSSGCRMEVKQVALGAMEGVENSLGQPQVLPCLGEIKMQEVSIPWSRSLEGREERFSRSILLSWKGNQRANWVEVERAILRRWSGMPNFLCWPLGGSKAIIRLPSLSMKELFIREEGLELPNGRVSFKKEVIRSIVQVWGHLLEVSEVELSREAFPVLRVEIWVNARVSVTPSLRLNLDGWKGGGSGSDEGIGEPRRRGWGNSGEVR